MISNVVFAALPLFLNLAVWSLVHGSTVWLPFQVEDLCYFAILLSGETLFSLSEKAKPSRLKGGALLLSFLVVGSLAASTLLGFWHRQQADPPQLRFSGEARRIVRIAAVIAGGTLVTGAVTQLVLPPHDPTIPSKRGVWLAVRVGSAFLPILFSSFFGLLVPPGTPYSLLRVNDLSFLAIALAGPAIIDLVLSPRVVAVPRLICAMPLLLIIMGSSLVLGCWYFTSAQPPVPGFTGNLASRLVNAASVFACASIAAGFASYRQVHGLAETP